MTAHTSKCLISTNVTGYYNHLYGAITILKSRGRRKFRDQLGAELFMLLRFELVSWRQRTPRDSDISELTDLCSAV